MRRHEHASGTVHTVRNSHRRVLWVCAASAGLFGLLLPIWYWNRTGGWYGVYALIDGHNPLRLVPTTKESEAESRARGDRIVAAIRTYREQNGRYPGQLNDLVPDFLPEIEQPTVGDCRWNYRADRNHGFVLSYFVGPTYETDWYEVDTGQWHVNR